MSEEDKIPYLVENKERDTFTIYVKGTKPYLDLQQENKQLKDKIEKLKDYGEAVGERRNQLYDKIDKAIEILKDTSVDMPSTLLIETIDYARHILGDKENE